MNISLREWVDRKYEKTSDDTVIEGKDGSVTVTKTFSSSGSSGSSGSSISTRYASRIIYEMQTTPPSDEALKHIVLCCDLCNKRILKESAYFYSCKKCSSYDICNQCFPKLVIGGRHYGAHDPHHTFHRVEF